jgi:uncharacterized DUF497 family protein
VDFEWDEAKNASNLKKHDLDFDAATRAFKDPWALDEEDLSSEGERRFNRIGMAVNRLVVVTYTLRGEVCRIISARKARPHERRRYHETKD